MSPIATVGGRVPRCDALSRSQPYEPSLEADATRWRRPPLRRAREGRWLGGVAAGIAQHLGLSTTLVRLFLALSVFAAGFGLVVYILLWILTPVDEGGTARLLRRAA